MYQTSAVPSIKTEMKGGLLRLLQEQMYPQDRMVPKIRCPVWFSLRVYRVSWVTLLPFHTEQRQQISHQTKLLPVKVVSRPTAGTAFVCLWIYLIHHHHHQQTTAILTARFNGLSKSHSLPKNKMKQMIWLR